MDDKDRNALELVGILGIELIKDGNKWSLLWGPNIQEGVCAFGDTPIIAVRCFHTAFYNEKITNLTNEKGE